MFKGVVPVKLVKVIVLFVVGGGIYPGVADGVGVGVGVIDVILVMLYMISQFI